MARRSTHPTAETARGGRGPQPKLAPEEREERLRSLRERWHELEAQYVDARGRNAQQLMSNLRGLLLVKREIGRLGGELPEFPYAAAQRRKMRISGAA